MPTQVRMKHIVVRCPDGRFHGAFQGLIEEFNLEKEGGYDLLSWPGASLPLCGPAREVFLGQIETLRRLHGNSEVWVLDHDDCGAFGQEGEADPAEEHQRHADCLRQAAALISTVCPEIIVRKFLVFEDGCFQEIDGVADSKEKRQLQLQLR